MSLGRTQLRALLAAGSSIVFDARARELAEKTPVSPTTETATAAPAPDEPERLPPFFEHSLLKNCILFKTIEHEPRQQRADQPFAANLQTRLYFPYDATQTGDGGVSLVHDEKFSRATLEAFFDVRNLDDERIRADLRKLAVFAKVPSFSPFLLRDAFERAAIKVDNRYFRITDDEAFALRDNLKAKLKPLAAMALELSPSLINGNQLDTLVRKLWQLDDPAFLLPLSRALAIDDAEAIEVFYAWIGVSFFQSEFAARQSRLRALADWVVNRSQPIEYVKDAARIEYETDRKIVRERLRSAWASVRAVFSRYNESYDALISSSQDPRPFVRFLQNVRGDFMSLGERLSMIEQCLSMFDFTVTRRAGRLNFDALQHLMRGMREISVEVDLSLQAA